MSDAPAAPVTENGVPPTTQVAEEPLGFKVRQNTWKRLNIPTSYSPADVTIIDRFSQATLRTLLRMKG